LVILMVTARAKDLAFVTNAKAKDTTFMVKAKAEDIYAVLKFMSRPRPRTNSRVINKNQQ